MKHLYHVAVAPGVDYDCIADEAMTLADGDRVIIRCERYQDIGTIVECHPEVTLDTKEADERHARAARGRQVEGKAMPTVMRLATESDLARGKENDARAGSALHSAVEQVAAHGLEMKLVNGHVSFDRRLIVLQFSADGRVDFRQLLRDLSRRLHMRVELRQIGVRDEASIQGGIGACGRAFCCSTFMKRFRSINVKMAKRQGLSLNPASISGCCGRLKCCLHYEAHLYRNGRLIREEGEGAAGGAGGREDARPRSGDLRSGRGGSQGRRGTEARKDARNDAGGSQQAGEAGEASGNDGKQERQSSRRSGRRRRRRRPRSRAGGGGGDSSSTS